MSSLDSFKARRKLSVGTKTYTYFSLKAAEKNGLAGISRLPNSLKILLENLLRHEDGRTVTAADIKAVAGWLKQRTSDREIAYRPARVLMQDFTGVPAVVDLAAMRDAMKALNGDPEKINPLAPVDLIIDHSVQVDFFAGKGAFKKNVTMEYERNGERYSFLRWGQQGFNRFRVVPPGTGICHQVNLEYLAQTVWTDKVKEGKSTVEYAYPDTLVGTDSHTTMINGLSVLGWGVGGIEAEAAMLGQPISMLIPEVIGMRFTGKLRPGCTATDLVLTVTQMLRKKGVVGKFVEFYGEGLADMPLEDRATIGNMAPEYGATCGFFPIDEETLRFLKATGRKTPRIALVEKYAKAQGMFHTAKSEEPAFTDTLHLDLSTVESSLAGPRRPQDRVSLSKVGEEFASALIDVFKKEDEAMKRVKIEGTELSIGHGDVVIAAITSCTNTSNPYVMLGAGLLARNAIKRGLLDKPLDRLGFNLVGYGCTTCIGNSGPLPDPIAKAVTEGDLVVGAVLSGNRNFEGRVHAQVRANYLASPMLVVAYALAGNLNGDLTKEPIGYDDDNEPVYLNEIWPSPKEIAETVRKSVTPAMFRARYADVFTGDRSWKKIKVDSGKTYRWPTDSTYVKNPPYFEGMGHKPSPITDISKGRVLGIFADSITTDHISPAGSIKKEGGNTIYYSDSAPSGEEMSIYDAAMKYQAAGTPTIIIAGKEYGAGSSRDWAAKGPRLLGVRAVIAENYERIHRSNLVGMGVMPLEFADGKTRRDYALTGKEAIDIPVQEAASGTRKKVTAKVTYLDGRTVAMPLVARIDTVDEIAYFKSGGILQHVLRNLLAA